MVGFYGKSGSGKTMSALLFARGIVGPAGRIVLVDSENGRGSLFADMIPGGYKTIDLDAPFSPDRYEGAIVAAEAQADCVVVDSMTHEHNGEGGVLDWAEAELQKMGGGDNNKMRSWIKPKMAHKMMVQRLLRCKCALICCLRGEEKTHIIKDGQKNKVVTDEFSTPIYDPRFLFELLITFETVHKNGQGGYVIARKLTHPAIGPLMPKDGEQIGERHGAALAAWCANPGSKPAAAPDDLAALKNKLWVVLKPIFAELGTALHAASAQSFLVGKKILQPDKGLANCTSAELSDVISKAEIIALEMKGQS